MGQFGEPRSLKFAKKTKGKAAMLSSIQRQLHADLGIPEDYGADGRLPYYAEAPELVDVGPNLVGRMQQLTPAAAAQWTQMVDAATSDGLVLFVVSGYRSFDHQAALIQKKLDAGQTIEEILTVNAAPGFSQHHAGGAADIATPGSRPLTEEFEDSPAFAWLTEFAAEFGFAMTYPRDNEFGFIYEPWHWALTDGESGQSGESWHRKSGV